MKTVALCNLGCSKNLVDGENITSYLGASGFQMTEDPQKAHIIIVNTCTFIQEATQEAIDSILEMAQFKQQGLCTTLIVSGCFSQRYKSTVQQQFPEVDYWLSIKNWQRELSQILELEEQKSFQRILSNPIATQYIKISDGCSHRCAFCIIPSIRGSFKSRSIKEITQEAQWLSDQGVKECILVSQDTSFYGRDQKSSLANLVEQLLKETDFPWIRMMYLHPQYVDNELLSLIAAEDRVCSYLDIPLQHIAEPVLKAMGRTPTSSDSLYALVEKVRSTIPQVTIRTSFIVGHPGETKNHFDQLINFLEWARFEKVGVFPFSPEEGTRSYAMKPRPRISTAQKRCELLMDVQREISREHCESLVGETRSVIIDKISDNPDFNFEARTKGDAPEVDGRVFILKGDTSPGSFSQVKIIGADDYDLYGEIIDS